MRIYVCAYISMSNGDLRDLAHDYLTRINGWLSQRPPIQLQAEMIRMFETRTFDLAHLDRWLRGFAAPVL